MSNQFGDSVPDVDDPSQLKALVAAINQLRREGKLLAYHDRSDGGLWAAVCEMGFAGHLGVSLNVDLLVTEGDGISDSRAEYGDSKNWAGQVGARWLVELGETSGTDAPRTSGMPAAAMSPTVFFTRSTSAVYPVDGPSRSGGLASLLYRATRAATSASAARRA